MSENSEEAEKKKAESAKQSGQPQQEQPESRPASTQPPAQPSTIAKPASTQAVSRPTIGTPIGRPTIGTPVGRPSVGTPIGKPVSAPTVGKPVGTSQTPASPPATTTVGAATSRPVIGRPSVGTPAIGTPRPGGVLSPVTAPGKPVAPQKRVETKQDVSRRNFLRGIAILGGIVAIAQFGALGPFIEGTVGSQGQPTQKILDIKTGNPLRTADIAENDWKTFVWPRTGDANVDNDTFSQCVVIHLPKNLTAPLSISVKDPKTGDTFIAFSRVCVHLWCLWSYVASDQRMECPCHGSQYVPGTGAPWNRDPGMSVLGPASLQTPPNNQLPIILLSIDSNGTISAKGLVGQIGCGQKC